ncbi:MAG: hypothetical protein EB828_02835 [Nitrosopumilus sp. D6]|nr:MAG: hypothetical protein EB828_02835 [Nitrosopumilus sp. D6]
MHYMNDAKMTGVKKPDDKLPLYKDTTSGLTSPMQLVDTTKTTKILKESTDASHISHSDDSTDTSHRKHVEF